MDINVNIPEPLLEASSELIEEEAVNCVANKIFAMLKRFGFSIQKEGLEKF